MLPCDLSRGDPSHVLELGLHFRAALARVASALFDVILFFLRGGCYESPFLFGAKSGHQEMGLLVSIGLPTPRDFK